MSSSSALKVSALPKIKEDGSNWYFVRERALVRLASKGLKQHILGLARYPESPVIGEDGQWFDPENPSVKMTRAQIKDYQADFDDYDQKEAEAKDIIFDIVSKSTFMNLQIDDTTTAAQAWQRLLDIYQKKTPMVRTDLRTKLASMKCLEGGNMRSHISDMRELRETLAGMGASIDDEDFNTHLRLSVPPSYDNILVSLDMMSEASSEPVTSESMIRHLLNHFDHMSIRKTTDTRTSDNVAAVASSNNKGKKKSNKTCENCKKKGHEKSDCWAKGGGAEGQAPKRFSEKKEKKSKGKEKEETSANAAETKSEESYALVAAITANQASLESIDYALALANRPEYRGMIIDCGATRHFTPNRNRLIDYVETEPETVTTADGNSVTIIGKGKLKCYLPMGQNEKPTLVTLSNVWYSPEMAYTLISVQTIAKTGHRAHFEGNLCTIIGPTNSRVIGRIPLINGLYRVTEEGPQGPVAAVTSKPITISELHRRLGHVNYDDLRRMIQKGTITGINLDLTSKPEFCDVCMKSKATRLPFPKASERKGITAYGNKVVSDVWGPAKVQTLGGKKYYVLFKDVYSCEERLYLLRTKDEVLNHYKKYHMWVQVQRESRIKIFGSDRGGEFLSGAFSEFLDSVGTVRHLTTHDSPQSNGSAERGNRTHIADVRAMLMAARLPVMLWGEALQYSVWIRNRTPTSALPDAKTPYEMATGERPDLGKAMEWGRKVFVRILDAGKLQPRAEEARFVGFDWESKGIRIFWPKKRSVSIERDVYINKDEALVPGNDQNEEEMAIFDEIRENRHVQTIPEAPNVEAIAPKVNEPKEDDGAAKTTLNEPKTTKNEPVLPKIPPKLEITPPTPPTKPEPIPEPGEDAPNEPARPVRRNRAPNDGLGEPEANTGRGFRERKPAGFYKETATRGSKKAEAAVAAVLDGLESLETGGAEADLEETRWFSGVRDFAMLAGDDEPTSADEAFTGPDGDAWLAGLETEISQAERLKAWRIVVAPPNANVNGSRLVFRLKRDSAGKVVRYRTRVVAKGFTQIHGIDYIDTFAPVVKLPTLRALLAFAAHRKATIHQADVKNAYLNSNELKVPIYMDLPPGYTKIRQLPPDLAKAKAAGRRVVCELLKPLYGTKQGAHDWYQTLKEVFLSLGYSVCAADQAVFYLIKSENDFTIVACATDDFTIIANSVSAAELIKKLLAKHFELVDLGPAKWLLGIKIEQDIVKGTISLSQESYAKHIVKLMGLNDANPTVTPLEPGIDLDPDAEGTSKTILDNRGISEYRQAIGLLMYLALGTRPDIMYAVSTLAQFMAAPRKTHLIAAKRVFCYIKGTLTLALTLGGDTLVGYSDADFASHMDRHSISGFCFFIGSGVISWSSKKQPLVTLSSVESEYVALTHAAKELIWLRRLIQELFVKLDLPTILYCDNQGAITISKDSTFHMRTKHIDTRFHFIRQTVNNDQAQIIYCPTDKMIADIFTKSLGRVKLEQFRRLLGLENATSA